ncbi:hypothetical protein P261_02198 [Lachnospiraceae bacterium TWA4]|nr:hypothetical protein P261_02198 [Lachnospiraceae bacterium TWA4]
MLGRTHMPVGILCGMIALYETGPVSWLDLGCGCMAASLASTLPDCDQYNSRPLEAVYDIAKFSAFSILYMFIKKGHFEPLMIPIFAAVLIWGVLAPHRGRTHSFVALFIFTSCFYAFIPNDRYTLCFGISYLSHLVLDLLNKKENCYFGLYKKDMRLESVRQIVSWAH